MRPEDAPEQDSPVDLVEGLEQLRRLVYVGEDRCEQLDQWRGAVHRPHEHHRAADPDRDVAVLVAHQLVLAQELAQRDLQERRHGPKARGGRGRGQGSPHAVAGDAEVERSRAAQERREPAVLVAQVLGRRDPEHLAQRLHRELRHVGPWRRVRPLAREVAADVAAGHRPLPAGPAQLLLLFGGQRVSASPR